jgi:hypothetical protein
MDDKMSWGSNETKNGLHKRNNKWMQMTSTNGSPLMKTSGNYHLAYQHWIHVQLVTTML